MIYLLKGKLIVLKTFAFKKK